MPHVAGWEPEEPQDDEWSKVKLGYGRQRSGRITDTPTVQTGHQNRAGRRLYVKVLQNRQGRINIVGFGRWRKHNESTEPSHAALTAPVPLAPRSERRAGMIAAYRAQRNARLGR